MNNTTNSSAPTSPSGNIVEATTDSLSSKPHNAKILGGNDKLVAAEQQQQDSEEQKLFAESDLSRPLGNLLHAELSSETPAELTTQGPASTSESLKVKIKTNNINAPLANPSTNDRNNNTSNNPSSNNKLTDSPTISNKNCASPASTPKSTNSRAGGRKNKQNNGDTSSATSNSTSNSINSSFSSTGSDSPATGSGMNAAKAQPIMNNYQSLSPNENGKKNTSGIAPISMDLAPPSNQSPQVQPTPLTQAALQPQSQQPPLPLIPQPQASAQPTPALPPTNLIAAAPPSASTTPQTTPKPKATRAKKQPAANNKNANPTDAIKPAKPEPKTRTKKAKQTAETKKAAATVGTPATTSASTQPPAPISSATTSAMPTGVASFATDKKLPENQRQSATTPAKKRKPRATAVTDPNAQPTNPPKRTRKKKSDPAPLPQPKIDTTSHINPPPVPMSSNMTLPPLSVNPQLLSVASNIPMGASPLMSNAPQSSYPGMQPLNRNMPGMSPLDVHDHHQRYVSVSLSPYANLETNSLARQHSLSKLLFTSSSATSALQTNPHSDEISKAFEELREHSWTHLSKCILEPAQQFDIPSLIGTLYELRADNERQLKRVKDLTLQREQLAAMNAKLDLTGPMLLQNLNQTSPSFASVTAALQNSPKSLPNSSPSPAMNKSPIVPSGAYNHVPPGSSLGPPGILYDRSSPMVGLQTQHSGVNSLKSSMISTPSPPTSAFMAHGANNRSGLMTVNNSPYMSSVHPSMSALNPLGGQAPPSYYPRQ